MEACAWCMPKAAAVAAPALGVCLANGRRAKRASRSPRERPAPSACRWGCAAPQAGTGVVESTDAPVSSSCAKSRVEIQVGPSTSTSLAIESASLSRAERAHSRLSWTERLARPCTSRDFWTGDDPTVRRPRVCCDLARIGHRLNTRVCGKARASPTEGHSRLRSPQLPDSPFARATQSSASSGTPCCPRKRRSPGCMFGARDACCTTGALQSL